MEDDFLRNVAKGDILTTPSFELQHKGYRKVGEFSPYLGETLIVMRKEEVDE